MERFITESGALTELGIKHLSPKQQGLLSRIVKTAWFSLLPPLSALAPAFLALVLVCVSAVLRFSPDDFASSLVQQRLRKVLSEWNISDYRESIGGQILSYFGIVKTSTPSTASMVSACMMLVSPFLLFFGVTWFALIFISALACFIATDTRDENSEVGTIKVTTPVKPTGGNFCRLTSRAIYPILLLITAWFNPATTPLMRGALGSNCVTRFPPIERKFNYPSKDFSHLLFNPEELDDVSLIKTSYTSLMLSLVTSLLFCLLLTNTPLLGILSVLTFFSVVVISSPSVSTLAKSVEFLTSFVINSAANARQLMASAFSKFEPWSNNLGETLSTINDRLNDLAQGSERIVRTSNVTSLLTSVIRAIIGALNMVLKFLTSFFNGETEVPVYASLPLIGKVRFVVGVPVTKTANASLFNITTSVCAAFFVYSAFRFGWLFGLISSIFVTYSHLDQYESLYKQVTDLSLQAAKSVQQLAFTGISFNYVLTTLRKWAEGLSTEVNYLERTTKLLEVRQTSFTDFTFGGILAFLVRLIPGWTAVSVILTLVLPFFPKMAFVSLGFTFVLFIFSNYSDFMVTLSRGKHANLRGHSQLIVVENRPYRKVIVPNSGPTTCYWDAIAYLLKSRPEVVRARAISSADKLMFGGSPYLDTLEPLDHKYGGHDLWSDAISKAYKRDVVVTFMDSKGLRTDRRFQYGSYRQVNPIVLSREGNLDQKISHWMPCVRTSMQGLMLKSNIVYYAPYLAVVILWSILRPNLSKLMMLGYALGPLITLGLQISRFHSDGPYLQQRAGTHLIYSQPTLPISSLCPFDLSRSTSLSNEHVHVVGVAGSDFWMERLLSFADDLKSNFPNDGLVIYTRDSDEERVNQVMKLSKYSNFEVLAFPFENPAVVRSLRMAPMFYGDSQKRFHLRDIDWKITAFEHAARHLEGNVTINPFCVCAGPVMQGVCDFQGSGQSDHVQSWLGTYDHWAVYGADEVVSSKMPWRLVVSKMSPHEQVAMWIGAVVTKMAAGTSLLVSTHVIKPGERNYEFKECALSTFGGFEWLYKLHMMSAGTQTFCSWCDSSSVVKTSLFSWFGFGLINQGFFGAAYMSHFVSRHYCRDFFDEGLNDALETTVAKKTFAPLGALLTVPKAYSKAMDLRRQGYKAGLQDQQVRDAYMAWQISRRARNQSSLFSYEGYKSPLSSSIRFYTMCASPLFGSLAAFIVDSLAIPDSENILFPILCTLTGDYILAAAGLIEIANFLFLRSDNVTYGFNLVSATGTFKTGVKCFWHMPEFRLLSDLPHPLLGQNPNRIKQMITVGPRRSGWTYGWFGWERKFLLPPGMINLRCSSAIALSHDGIVDFRQPSQALVIGSGGGGFIQGMLNEGFSGPITAVTLPEEGYTLSSSIVAKNVVQITADINDITMMSDFVVVDATTPPSDDIWWRNDFSERDVALFHDYDMLDVASRRVNPGGTFIASQWYDDAERIVNLIDHCCLHYKTVDVLCDPVSRGPALVWVVGKHKRHIHDPLLNSAKIGEIHMKDPFTYEWTMAVTEVMGHFKAAYVNYGPDDLGSYWMTQLTSLFHLGVAPEQLVSFNYSYQDQPDAEIPVSIRDEQRSTNLRMMNFTFEPITKLEFYRTYFSEAYNIAGRMLKIPVQDRIFNTGIDLLNRSLLSEAQLLPLNRTMLVPPQDNLSVLAGLKHRYNFPRTRVNMDLFQPTIEWLKLLVSDSAKSFSFSTPTWDDIMSDVNKASTMGYMSACNFKNVGDALRNGRNVLDLYFDRLIRGEPLNHLFHASPKVERKEDEGEPMIPRLFQYKVGEVRLCEMRLFKPVNDFFGSSGNFTYSMKGDCFEKAERIVSAFEKFKDPASVEIESSKWDGHKEIEFFSAARDIMALACSSGVGGSIAAEVMKSTVLIDGFGICVMCSGHVVQFKRCCQKSGSWDTSINNKICNTIVAVALVSKALEIRPDETQTRVVILIEGDDGIVIGERDDILRIQQLRNWMYSEAGWPQRGRADIIISPESSRFCSHGATRLSNSICVPVRDLHEVFSRLIVPGDNNAFELNYQMAARSLNAAISFVAMYWYLPEARKFWEVLRQAIPKSVMVKAVSTSDRWKFKYQLGDLNPVDFDIKMFIEQRFFPSALNCKLNSKAVNELNLGDFASLQEITGSQLHEVLTMRSNPFRDSRTTLWYSQGVSLSDMLADVGYFKAITSVGVVTETSSQLRAIYTQMNSLDFAASWSSLKATIGRTTGVLFAIFSHRDKYVAETCAALFTKSELKRLGFRGSQFSVYILGSSDTLSVVKTSFSWALPAIASVIAALLIYFSKLRSTRTDKTAYVGPGVEVECNVGPVLIQPNTFQRSLSMPVAPIVHRMGFMARGLALYHLKDRVSRLSLSRHALLATVIHLTNTVRRVGYVYFDKHGEQHNFMFYKANWRNPLLLRQSWATRKTMATLLNLSEDEILPSDKWGYNGGMLTVLPWKGAINYGQFERPQKLFQSLAGSLKEVGFFVRIDDCPMMEANDRHPNKYIFDAPLVHPRLTYPVFGENTGDGYLDLPKPFDSEIIGSSSAFSPWSLKLQKAFFRGGLTGMGTTEETNTRKWLVSNSQQISDGLMKCDFALTSQLDRVCRDLYGNLSIRHELITVDPVSYADMGSSKVIIVCEGNEAPDRVAHCMETGSIVVYITPSHCLGTSPWWEPFLKHKFNALICRPDLQDLRSCLKFIKDNDAQAQEIATQGRLLALTLLDPTFQTSYMLDALHMVWQGPGTRYQVEEVLRWSLNKRVRHAGVYFDTDFQYSHGTALSLVAASTTARKLLKDIGCGVTLFSDAGLHMVPTFSSVKRLLKSGNLLNSEIAAAEDLFDSARLLPQSRERLLNNLGTLGYGNHFAEIVSNGADTLLLVHSGSRGFINEAFLSNDIELDLPLQNIGLLDIATKFASLNRIVCARKIGCKVIVEDIPHTTKQEATGDLAYLDGPVLLSNMLRCKGSAWLLGSPGSGIAHLKTSSEIVPHGMGGKGSRHRDLKQIKFDLWYRTCARVSSSSSRESDMEYETQKGDSGHPRSLVSRSEGVSDGSDSHLREAAIDLNKDLSPEAKGFLIQI